MRSISVTFNGRIPSLKNEKRIIRVRGRLVVVPSIAWNRYQREALKTMSKLSTPVQAPYKVSYVISMKGKGAQDIDNIITGANDLLQKLNYISDDKHILEIKARKNLGCAEYKTKVEIKTYAS